MPNLAQKQSDRIIYWIEDLSERQFAYLLLLPAFLLVSILAFWPIFRTIHFSLFADSQFTVVGEFVGIGNYVQILTGDAFMPIDFFGKPFGSAFGLTMVIAIGSVPLAMALGFGQALILNKKFRGRSLARVAFILPWAVPTVIQGMIFWLIFSPGIGFGTEYLAKLGFGNPASPLAYSVEGAFIVILAEVWKNSAFVAILLLAGLQNIDRSLYKVAQVSGASRLQLFRHITLPLVIPTLIIALIFRTIGGMRAYGVIQSTTGCDTLTTVICLAVDQFGKHAYGTSSTVAVLLAIMTALFVLIYLVYLQRSVNL